MKRNRFLMFCLFLMVVMAGCTVSEEELANQVAVSVAETAAAIPTVTPYPTLTPFPPLSTATPYPTLTPFPEPTAYPTFTPFPTRNLADLFCEYDFCIGHPTEAYLVDMDAPDEWSSYKAGSVFGIEDDTVMGVSWEIQTEARWDIEAEVLDFIGENQAIQGEVVQETIGDTLIAYASFNDLDPNEKRPYRLAAAWYCGNRGFVAMFVSDKDGFVIDLMRQALESFMCLP